MSTRDLKGVVIPGVSWGLFWPGNSLAGPSVHLGTPSASIDYVPTFVPFQPIVDAGRMRSASGQRESATNRRLETHGGKPKGGCGTECKPSPRQRLIRGRFFCLVT